MYPVSLRIRALSPRPTTQVCPVYAIPICITRITPTVIRRVDDAYYSD